VSAPLLSSVLALLTFAAIVVIRPAAFYFDDFQSQYVPAYVDIARALREGTFPLLSPYSWFGGALAGEYQYGVFSAFLLPVVGIVGSLPLSPRGIAVALAAVHLPILAAGVAVMMRARGASHHLAVLLGTAVPLSGFFFCWGMADWFPMVTAFTWAPWTIWAFTRALETPFVLRRASVAAVFLYLTLSGGWPFTCLSLLVFCAFEAVVACGAERSVRPLLPAAIAWVLGGLMASPALLMLLAHAAESSRRIADKHVHGWTVSFKALLGVLVPSLSVSWQGFGGITIDPAVDTFLGLGIPVIVVTALVRGRGAAVRRALPELLLTLLFTALSMFAAHGQFRWPFRWLPFQSLAIAALAARLDGEPPGRRFTDSVVLGTTAALAALGGLLVGIENGTRTQIGVALGLSALCVFWLAASRVVRSELQGAVSVLVSCTSLVWVHVSLPNPHMAPSWPSGRAADAEQRFDSGRTYLSVHGPRAVYGPQSHTNPEDWALVHSGNRGMLEARRWVNGYSPLLPRGLRDWLELDWSGYVHADLYRCLTAYMSPGGLFDQLGISGLVVPMYLQGADAWFALTPELAQHWAIVHSSPRYHLLQRSVAPAAAQSAAAVHFVPDPAAAPRNCPAGALPVLLSESSRARSGISQVGETSLEVLEDSRLRARVRVPDGRDEPSAIVFTRPYFDGYRAFFGDAELPVEAAFGIAPCVLVPPGKGGELTLVYRPRAVVYGSILAGLAVLVVVATLLRRERARRVTA
jgi:hypothetical protein